MATMMREMTPAEADRLQIRAGWALRQVASPKKLARATGRSERLAQGWCSGERASPVSRCARVAGQLARAGLQPWPLITQIRIEAMTAMSDVREDELAARMRQAMIEETAAQGDLDMLQMEYGPDRANDPEFLEELEKRAAAHASRNEEIAVYARLMRREAEKGAS